MNQWFKDQWPTFLVLILAALILVVIFRRSGDNGVQLTNYKIQELQLENDYLRNERDSMLKIVNSPIDESNVDSLVQVGIDLNNKTLYELRKKRAIALDTIGSDELRRIFAGYGQHTDPK